MLTTKSPSKPESVVSFRKSLNGRVGNRNSGHRGSRSAVRSGEPTVHGFRCGGHHSHVNRRSQVRARHQIEGEGRVERPIELKAIHPLIEKRFGVCFPYVNEGREHARWSQNLAMGHDVVQREVAGARRAARVLEPEPRTCPGRTTAALDQPPLVARLAPASQLEPSAEARTSTVPIAAPYMW